VLRVRRSGAVTWAVAALIDRSDHTETTPARDFTAFTAPTRAWLREKRLFVRIGG
jgi:hypothetical protein